MGAAPAFADSVRQAQWHLSFLKMEQVHKISQGSGVIVAVVDSGVDTRHLDLTGGVLPGTDLTGDGTDGRTDLDGHGTAMASLISGHGHGPNGRDGVLGLAPAARILPVRALRTRVQGGRDEGPAIQWAVDHGADVVNLSIGGSAFEAREALTNAIDRDVVIVVAIGNVPDDPAGVNPLTRHPGVIAVSGVDQRGSFASISMQGKEVVLAAPAERVMAATIAPQRYEAGPGTSNAAALVSGAVALVRARFPDMDAKNVINRLIKTADDRGPKGRDPQYGFGIVNPLRALTVDVPPVEQNPLITPSRSHTRVAPRPRSSSGLGIVLIATALIGLVAIPLLVLIMRRRRVRQSNLGTGGPAGPPRYD